MADNKNMTQEEIDNGEEMTVTLTLDDGREIECVVLTIFPAGGKDYIALLPMDDIEAEDGEVYLYRYSEDENGQPNLENIEDDDCLLYTSPSPRDLSTSRMPSSA